MTLDEAIKHCEEKAEAIWQTNEEMPHDCKLSKDLCECAKEHEQLAEWLKELKNYRLRFGEKNCSKCKHHAESAFAYPCAECAYSHDVLFEEGDTE